MTRVGFRLIGSGWQGGLNYLWNLLYAVTSRANRRVQPVLLARPDEELQDLVQPGVERFPTDPRLDSDRARQLGRALKLATGRNLVEERWLQRARIDVASHGPPVGKRVPTISWVPDVQHRHLPDLASRFEHTMRDLLFREMLRDAAVVVTSSETARQDLIRFYGLGNAELRVLRFVSQPRLAPDKIIPLDALRAKLGVPARFFHLPNQLWKHKNHLLVVEALRLAPEVVVVATGPKENYRHPEVYRELMARVGSLGLGDRFRHLGLVSFPELISLMRHSVAVINPSRFEGWSTTVEEAKSLGKRALISDIPVHHEQAPPRASYFSVDDPAQLAALMTAAWATHDLAADERAAAEAAAALPARTAAFAETYEAIVADVARRHR